MSVAPWARWRALWCWMMHARFAKWRGFDIVCSRCNRVVLKDAPFTVEYRRQYGDPFS